MRLIFVCLGNLCRSPLAEAVMRDMAPHLEITSSGTSAARAGGRYDPTALRLARLHGLRMTGRVKRLRAADLEGSPLVVCMDEANAQRVRVMLSMAESPMARVHLLREWDAEGPGDVPNPSGRSPMVWAAALEMIQRGCKGLHAAGLEPGCLGA